jgi:hypothetical protein
MNMPTVSEVTRLGGIIVMIQYILFAASCQFVTPEVLCSIYISGVSFVSD